MKTANQQQQIRVNCTCGKVLYLPLNYLGKKIRCPNCAYKLAIPKQLAGMSEQQKLCACGAYLEICDGTCSSPSEITPLGIGSKIGGLLRRIVPHLPKLLAIAAVLLLYFWWFRVSYIPGDQFSQLIISEELEARLAKEYRQLEAMPQETAAQIHKKQLACQVFLQNYLPAPLAKTVALEQSLARQGQEADASQKFMRELQQDKNPLRILLRLNSLHLPLPAKLKNQRQQAEQELLLTLRSHAAELTQLIQERRLAEITSRTTPRLLNLLGDACFGIAAAPEARDALMLLSGMYEQISDDRYLLDKNSPLDEQSQWRYYEKYFAQYTKRFKQLMLMREYDLAQEGLENLWESLHSIDNMNAEDELIRAVRDNLREAQAVKTFFSIAGEGARACVGTNQNLVLKNSATFSGKILYYSVGCFTLQIKGDKKLKIAMKQLCAEDVARFALKYKTDKHIYEYAGVFYWYEAKPELAKQAFNNALAAGADVKTIQAYLQVIQHESQKHPATPDVSNQSKPLPAVLPTPNDNKQR